MEKNLLYVTYFFLLVFIAAGCKKDDDVQKKLASELIQTSVSGVNGPTSGMVKKDLTFSLLWQNTNGALKFDHLEDSTADNVKFIRLFALTNVADTSAVKAYSTLKYKFRADTPGVYYLKFYRADNADSTAIIDTVTIK